MVNQPADDLAFERIVNVPKRGLGDKAVAKVQMLSRAQQIPLIEAATRIIDTDELTPQARRALGVFVRDLASWRDRASTLPHADLARAILDESGYTTALIAEKSTEASGRLENLNELTRAMEEYETLGAFLEHVSLVMDNEGAADGEKVTLMTIHAAKGLEFDRTFLVGWEEGVFPSQRAMDEGGLASLEEERRLAYVAITRARTQCTILHAANRQIYGQWTSSIPSRFVSELPEAHIKTESSMAGGESLWRTNFAQSEDPFAHLGRGTGRGPGWKRATDSYSTQPTRIVEARGSAVSLGNKGRSDVSVGLRIFHSKFGYGNIAEIEGNKLEIDFESAGRKRVLDSFVTIPD